MALFAVGRRGGGYDQKESGGRPSFTPYLLDLWADILPLQAKRSVASMRNAVCHHGAVAPRLGLSTLTYLPRKPAGAVGCGEGVRGGVECIFGGLLGGFRGSLTSSPSGGLASVPCGHFGMLIFRGLWPPVNTRRPQDVVKSLNIVRVPNAYSPGEPDVCERLAITYASSIRVQNPNNYPIWLFLVVTAFHRNPAKMVELFISPASYFPLASFMFSCAWVTWCISR